MGGDGEGAAGRCWVSLSGMSGDILGVMEVALLGVGDLPAVPWCPPAPGGILWDPLGSGGPAVPARSPRARWGSSMTSMGSAANGSRDRRGSHTARDPLWPGDLPGSDRGSQPPLQHPGQIHRDPERDPGPAGGSGRPGRSRADPEQILGGSRVRWEQIPHGSGSGSQGSVAQSGSERAPRGIRRPSRSPGSSAGTAAAAAWPGRAGDQGHPGSRRPVPTFSCSFSISSLCASSDSSSTRRCAVSFLRNSISLRGPAASGDCPTRPGDIGGFGAQGRTLLRGMGVPRGAQEGAGAPREAGNVLGWKGDQSSSTAGTPSLSQGAPGPVQPGLDG